MRKNVNPFLISESIDHKKLYQRERELKEMHEHIEKGKNMALLGRRGSGKTIMAKQFLVDLEKSKRFEALYINLIATKSMEEAIAAIIIGIYDKFGNKKTPTKIQAIIPPFGVSIDFHPYTGKPIISKGQKSFAMTERSLTYIGQFLSQRKKPLLICLDDFQLIAQYEEGNEEAIFRGWAQQFPLLRFLFIGSPPEMMINIFAIKNRPFYQSVEMVKLESVPLQDYTKYIQGQFTRRGKTISDKMVSKIYALARGETYMIQLCCYHLFDYTNVVKEDDLARMITDILHQRETTFSDYSRMLTRNQWNLFKAVAKEEPLYNPLSKDFVNKHQLGAVSAVSTALKALQKLGLVIQDDGAYLVHDVLIARWMARLV